MAVLPQPEVSAEFTANADPGGKHKLDIVISRDGKGRAYHSEEYTIAETVKGAVDQILNDPYTAEHVRKG